MTTTHLFQYKRSDPANIDRPQIGSLWRHKSGEFYTVEGFSNEASTRQDEYPTTIFYRDSQNVLWSLPLAKWFHRMTFVRVRDGGAKDVKRYSMGRTYENGIGSPGIVEQEDGEFIRYEDHIKTFLSAQE